MFHLEITTMYCIETLQNLRLEKIELRWLYFGFSWKNFCSMLLQNLDAVILNNFFDWKLHWHVSSLLQTPWPLHVINLLFKPLSLKLDNKAKQCNKYLYSKFFAISDTNGRFQLVDIYKGCVIDHMTCYNLSWPKIKLWVHYFVFSCTLDCILKS